MTRLATMAKLKAGRLGRELTDACLQFWGGMRFTNETPVSRAYRDSRLTSIGGGADEVMLITTGGQLVRIFVKDIREAGRNTQGVKLINLAEGDKLQAIAPVLKALTETRDWQ